MGRQASLGRISQSTTTNNAWDKSEFSRPLRLGLGLRKVDINGDGMMEWDEFTRFVVVKAQLHHAQMSIDQLAEYHQGARQVRKKLGKNDANMRYCPLPIAGSPTLVTLNCVYFSLGNFSPFLIPRPNYA